MEANVNIVRFAAVIDCEGWITIQKLNNARGVGLVLTLGVGNTNFKLTDWLKETFGGSTYVTRRESNNHKDYSTWRIHGNKALELLKQALPYMLLKQSQAEIAIEFQTTMHGKNSYNEPCTPEYVENMFKLKKQMNQLNRKGKAISPATTERDDTKLDQVSSSEATV